MTPDYKELCKQQAEQIKQLNQSLSNDGMRIYNLMKSNKEMAELLNEINAQGFIATHDYWIERIEQALAAQPQKESEK